MMARTPTKKGQHKSRKDRRNAMTTEEIEEMKKNLLNTPRKQRGKLRAEETDISKEERTITLNATTTFPRQMFTTPLETADFWKQEIPEMENRLSQIRIYCILNNRKIEPDEMQILCTAVFNLTLWESQGRFEIDTLLPRNITRKLETPSYKLGTSPPWLVQRWPEILQYVVTGNLYQLTEGNIEKPISTSPEEEADNPFEASEETSGSKKPKDS